MACDGWRDGYLILGVCFGLPVSSMDLAIDSLQPICADADGEFVPFDVHSSIIGDLIALQAGSLSKAVLELVMNALDAKASSIAVESLRSGTALRVRDDGRGFESEAEIREYFATFGFPHDVGGPDRRFGRFGLGRGQIMAYGSAVWRSRGFEMRCVKDSKGHGFRLLRHAHGEPAGCEVEVELRFPLHSWDFDELTRALGHALAYVDADVRIDGRRVGVAPESVLWTRETERLRLRVDPFQHGLSVYSQGVLVTSYSHACHGVSGVLVSRNGSPFVMTLARNEIVERDCPLWEEALGLLAEQRQARRRQGTLTDADRAAWWRDVLCGRVRSCEVWRSPVLKLVSGRSVSPSYVCSVYHGCFSIAPRLSSAVGDQAIRRRLAAVLVPETNAWLGLGEGSCEGDAEIVLSKLFAEEIASDRCANFSETFWADLDEAVALARIVVPVKEWTRTEHALMAGLRAMGAVLSNALGYRAVTFEEADWSHWRCTRRIELGEAGGTAAWTDGRRWIGFDRFYLARHGRRGWPGWRHLSRVLLHEYAHDVPDGAAHMHDMEFLLRMHDTFLSPRFNEDVVVCAGVSAYEAMRARRGLVPDRILRRRVIPPSRGDRMRRSQVEAGLADPG